MAVVKPDIVLRERLQAYTRYRIECEAKMTEFVNEGYILNDLIQAGFVRSMEDWANWQARQTLLGGRVESTTFKPQPKLPPFMESIKRQAHARIIHTLGKVVEQKQEQAILEEEIEQEILQEQRVNNLGWGQW